MEGKNAWHSSQPPEPEQSLQQGPQGLSHRTSYFPWPEPLSTPHTVSSQVSEPILHPSRPDPNAASQDSILTAMAGRGLRALGSGYFMEIPF